MTTMPAALRSAPRLPPSSGRWSALLAGAMAAASWAASGSSAHAATGGPDGYGYTWRDSFEPGVTFAWEDISATGTELTLDGDDYNLGLRAFTVPIRYYGLDYTTIGISSNGWVSFVDGTSISATNTPMPALGGPRGNIALFWDDLRVTAGVSRLLFQEFPDRIVVTYQNVHRLGRPADLLTFQLVAYTDGTLAVQYSRLLGTVSSATLGIESPDESHGLTVHHNTGALPTTAYRVEFTPPIPVNNDLDCGSVGVLPCPSITSADLAAGAANQDAYRCGAVPMTGFTGREQIWRIDVATPTDLDITLTPLSGNPTAFLLAGCDPNACLSPPGSSFLLQDILPGSYYVVVDSVAGQEGAYTIETECLDLGDSFPFCNDEALFESQPYGDNGSWLVYGWLFHPWDSHDFSIRVDGTDIRMHQAGSVGCPQFDSTEAVSVQPNGPGLVTWTFPEGRIDAVMSEHAAGGCCGLLVEVHVTNTDTVPHFYEYRAYHDTAFGVGTGLCTTGVVDGGTIVVGTTRYVDEQDLLALGGNTCGNQVKMFSAEDPINLRSSYQMLSPNMPTSMEFIRWSEGGDPCNAWNGFVSGEIIGDCFDDNSLLFIWRFPAPSGTLAPGATAVARYRIGWECAWPCCEDPNLGAGTVQDNDPCREGGIQLRWDPAVFPPPGNGVYHVHRSTVSFADALASPRISAVGGLTFPAFDDPATIAGTTYYYVVQAESVDYPDCGGGPLVNGSTDTLNLGPVTDLILVVDAGAPKAGCVGSAIALSDSSGGTATALLWTDGGAGGAFNPGPAALHPTYTNGPGVYTLTLTGTITPASCSIADTVVVTIQPVPLATFVAPSACEDQVTCFTNNSVGPAQWLWDFGTGDGASSTEEQPCFVYSTPGTYTVTLSVTNDCGTNQTTRQVVVGPKPQADFSWSSTGGRTCVGQSITFTDLSTNSPTSWNWDFGDGTTSNLQNPSHTFATDGIKIVKLVACNACGCSPPHFEAISIAAACNTNCEANSNQIECGTIVGLETGDTCTEHDNFNTTSYPCAPGFAYTGENKIFDLNFLSGANFIVTVVETAPEPNGYDLDIMISLACNPPDCGSWGDQSVVYDDRTSANDDFWVIVDGRDGTCGPYRLDVQCLAPAATGSCQPPVFGGVASASDESPCDISGILVEWPAVTSWGLGTTGAACAQGTFEIWRALASDPTDELRVGTATTGSTSFVDLGAVPGVAYVYRVNAINTCCGEPTITTATAGATDLFADEMQLDAGPVRRLTCDNPSSSLLASISGGSGEGFDFAWTPAVGLSNPAILNPSASEGGTFTLTATDRLTGCTAVDSVFVDADTTPPTVTAGADKELTCTTTIVTLEGDATGGDGSAGYSYTWTPGRDLSNPSARQPTTAITGLFHLEVEDLATGCIATDDVLVVRNDSPPLATAGPDILLDCVDVVGVLQGGAFGGDGRDGYSFTWTPAAGLDDAASRTPTVSAPGTYTLRVVDLHTGCEDTDTVVATSSVSPPTADAGTGGTISCLNPIVTLTGAASGGDGSAGYAFAWRPAADVESPNSATTATRLAGTYTLTVTDLATGCTATDTVTVLRDPATPIADAGADGSITCAQPSATLVGAASGGDGTAGYTFRWEPAGQVANPDSANTTTTVADAYTLTITDVATGCTATDVVVVTDERTPPTANAGADFSLTCTLRTATLSGTATGGDGTQGYTFRWEPAGLVADPDGATTTTDRTGLYTLTVTDVASGCQDTDTVFVIDDADGSAPEPSPLDLRPGASPLTVEWFDGAQTQLLVSWEDVGTTIYNLHSGDIDRFHVDGYTHGALACDLAVPRATVAPPAGNAYFLAVSEGCLGAESSYGRNSLGAERPDSATASGVPCP